MSATSCYVTPCSLAHPGRLTLHNPLCENLKSNRTFYKAVTFTYQGKQQKIRYSAAPITRNTIIKALVCSTIETFELLDTKKIEIFSQMI
jgi:hypothetical protein